MNPGLVAAFTVIVFVGAVIGYFLFGVMFKLFWGWWPVLLSFVLGGWAIWHFGMEYIWMLAIPILGSIVGSWLWQRTSFFLAVDARLEKMFMMND